MPALRAAVTPGLLRESAGVLLAADAAAAAKLRQMLPAMHGRCKHKVRRRRS